MNAGSISNKMKQYSKYYPHSSVVFFKNEIDLILPPRDFIVGGSIPFEVKIMNLDIPVTNIELKLVQKMLCTKSTRKKNLLLSSSRHQWPKLKCSTTTVSHRICLAFSGSWIDTIPIPLVPPTKSISESCDEDVGRDCEKIIEIQYEIHVEVNNGAEFGFFCKAFPIQIKIAPSSVPGTSTGRPTNVAPLVQRRRHENYHHDDVMSMDDSFIGIGDREGPPSYSMLSLHILQKSSRSNSVETLPPHYDDIVKPRKK